EATRQTVARARRFWEICGKSANLELSEQQIDHHYTREMAAKSAEFFALHLLGKKIKMDNSKVSPIPAAQLYATKTGQVRGELKNARFVHDENKANVAQILKSAKAEPEKAKKARALDWLNAAVFNNRKPCPQNLRICYSGHANDLCFNNVFWWSQEGIINHGLVFRDYRFADRKLPLTVAVWTDGTSQLRSHMNWLRSTCAAGRAVMVLNVTGVGAIEQRKINPYPVNEWYGTVCRLAHDLMWLGDSITAFRAYDVIRALDAVPELPDIDGNDIELYGHGRQSVYALIAAALDPRVKSLREEEALPGYADLACARHYDDFDVNSIIFRGVLKYCDLPDIRKWLGKKYRQ
ncbi:MAG: alpha/beta hydrolase family protein, partial [Victivallaceae bacterium]